ncbi:MAG: M15 family metallopeptidase [Prevotellaceae bacterium]|jgi:D-alanyl-D-alanine dipeptidase|nr:M15 family metallopeptidase [Prevotellaceae bacterium]
MKYLKLLLCFIFPAFTFQEKEWDKRLEEMKFVDVQQLDSTIRIYLVYATPHNFMNETVYHGITKAWLHKDAASKLVKAQQLLKNKYPDYSLMVYDAARPFEVQRKMWNLVRGTKNNYYVANPAKRGGRHNYGMAVDVTVVDGNGYPVDMGTVYDFFGEEAHTNNEKALLDAGKITAEAYRNRQLLRNIMRRAGFTSVSSEWWHFNACSRDTARKKYRLIE